MHEQDTTERDIFPLSSAQLPEQVPGGLCRGVGADALPPGHRALRVAEAGGSTRAMEGLP